MTFEKRQERTLEFVRRRPASPGSVDRILDLLQVKSNEDSLDPELKEIWNQLPQQAKEPFPEEILEEADSEISKIQIVDEEVWEIEVHEDTKVVFLLGAGASAPSDIPTVDNLLPELWKRARRVGRDDLNQLVEWSKTRGLTDIEDLLTAAYIANFAARNEDVTALLDYFLLGGRDGETQKHLPPETRPQMRGRQTNSRSPPSSIRFLQDTLQTLFGLLTSTMIPQSPNRAHTEIVEFIDNHPRSSIITTNYDGLMDEEILNQGHQLTGTISGSTRTPLGAGIELIKMHGSINWTYCDSCQEVKEFDLLQVKELYELDEYSYAVVGSCKNCGGLRRPLLVPPLSFKFLMFPDLIDLWKRARERVEEADLLVVIGYSFSDADTYINKIIRKSMSAKKSQKMVLVNPDGSIADGLRNRMSARLESFEEGRILKVAEEAQEILPEILTSWKSRGPHQEAPPGADGGVDQNGSEADVESSIS